MPRFGDSRVSELLAPIAGASPAGENANYDARHEALRREVAKLESPIGGVPDWAQIAKGGEALLRETSKDYLIGAYVAWAWFELDGLTGLARGVALLHGLIERYWETGFPPRERMRGRSNAIGWFLGRFEGAVGAIVVGDGDRDPIEQLQRSAPELNAIVRETFGDSAPAMRALIDGVNRLALTFAGKPRVTVSGAERALVEPPPIRVPAVTEPAPAETVPAPTRPSAGFDPATLAERWISPISPDHPAGSDARYQPEHEAVRAEIAKLESVSAGEPDWAAIERDATKLLVTSSKDLTIAVYLARALHKLGGYVGLARGLALIAELCDRFWATMEPPQAKERRRANALRWLFEQLERELGEATPQAAEADAIARLEAAITHTLAVVRRVFESPPATRGLEQAIARLRLSVPPAAEPPPRPIAPDPTPKPAPAPAIAAPPPPAPAPSTPAPAPIVQVAPQDATQVLDYLRKLGADLVATAHVLRAANRSDPLGYRLLRTGLYLAITAPPPSQANGATTVPPPPADLLARLGLLKQHRKWPELLEETEGALARCRLCLDLHALSALALAELGHVDARDAVIDGVRSLIGRMPQLLALGFSSGAPLCGPEAKAWIDAEVLGDPSHAGGSATGTELPEELEAILAAAKQATGFAEAASAIQAGITTIGAARPRFVARLALAEIATTNAPRVALGLYAGLAREAERRGLDRWEPQLTARCLDGLVRVQAQASKHKPPLTSEPAFERLCRLDPVAASRLPD